ncbi:hypothetical protein EV182_004970 [Spiromyces aspiralis]|uniref:Uncharacterized protein n=1 Tax=Spiromyces aspiralis TaxID=68401 RepID=A0ACC1HVV4_9FUNG|nr:hypothetical protein EV182_004970 [Spiromyces aspiralis]
MPRNGKRTRPMPNRDTFHRLIKWHALHGETHHAQAYLDLMRSATYNIQPTHQTFKHIINRRVATKDWDFTLGVATLMQDKLNLPLIESMANSLARAWDYIQERSRARAERELLERERREAMRTQLFAAEEVAAESDDMGQRP